jgi:hypothetical protein
VRPLRPLPWYWAGANLPPASSVAEDRFDTHALRYRLDLIYSTVSPAEPQ